MIPRTGTSILHRLASAAPAPEATGDVHLVRTFLTSRCDIAFAELVRRHGSMVYAVCRRVLGHTRIPRMLPAKAGDLRFLVPRWPVEGRDITTQLRDVSAAMRLRMLGQEPEFGFDRQQVRDRGKPDDVFDLRDRV